jgi:hypothetical protein
VHRDGVAVRVGARHVEAADATGPAAQGRGGGLAVGGDRERLSICAAVGMPHSCPQA